MNFEFSTDQAALLDAVDKVAARHRGTPQVPKRLQYAADLWRDLSASGFFDCLRIEELGALAATAMVIALTRLPLCVELVASALIAPKLGTDLSGPFAVTWGGSETAPIRFLPVARTLIRIRDGGVDSAALDAVQVDEQESLFAYPIGTLRDPESIDWTPHPRIHASSLRDLWRLGVGAEIVGCLDAGLQSVLEHVKERRQFGRPLGSFQAVQHRLAECTTLIEGARWLVLRAAGSGSTLDACIAVGQAQRIAARVSYDLHQFMGAMGLTLEHPLHRWTYRVKLLRADLGGADRHFIAAAEAAWGADALANEGIRT